MTFLGEEIQSYKQLPQVWYHFSTKDRDEPRPRGGLLRLREFIMKDSYTFDADEAGLDAAFERHQGAYARIFERCGLEAYLVQAESGTMGGKDSLGFLAPTGSGEDELMRLANGDCFVGAAAGRGEAAPPAARCRRSFPLRSTPPSSWRPPEWGRSRRWPNSSASPSRRRRRRCR